MANQKINTRILLRNDTLANWQDSSLALAKGEVAIATGIDGNLAEVRVGNNSTWANSLKLAVDVSQIDGISAQISAIALQYQLAAGSGADANKWFLQAKPLDGTGEWQTISTLDLTQLTGYALSTDVDTRLTEKNKVEVAQTFDGAFTQTDLSVIKVTDADLTAYAAARDGGTLNSNAVYILDLSAPNALGQKVENVAPGTVSSDAATYGQLTAATTGAIDALSATVAATYLSAATFNAISNDIGLNAASTSNKVATLSDVTAATTDISGTVAATYLSTSAFDDYKDEVGLSAASSSNPVVTKSDIADLAGAMHFRGAVSDPSEITDPAAGDIIIIPSTSKEYVYNGTEWIELGDEVLYATKAEVNNVSADLTARIDYLSGQIDTTNATLNTVSSDYLKAADKTELTALIGTVSAETLVSANAYTDDQIAALSIGDYALSADVDALVAATSAATYTSAYNDAKAYADGLSATVSTDYMTKTDVSALVGTVSVDTAVSAYGAAKDYVDGILDGYLILDCGGSTLRTDEPTAPFSA